LRFVYIGENFSPIPLASGVSRSLPIAEGMYGNTAAPTDAETFRSRKCSCRQLR
jgi:hypothetical protein